MAEPRKRPYPRPIDGRVEEDGSFSTVGGWVRDAETKRMRPANSGIVNALMIGKKKRRRR